MVVATLGFEQQTIPSDTVKADANIAIAAPAINNNRLAISLPSVGAIDLPPVPVKNPETTEPYMGAAHVFLMDSESGMTLYDKGADIPVPVASTTKIVTSILAMENYKNLEQVVTISKECANQIGSAVGFRAGESATIHQLLWGLLMVSGNDAACALAEQMAQSGDTDKTARFVAKMNEFASRIGEKNAHFNDPAGLDDINGRATAETMAKAFKVLLEFPQLKEIVGTLNHSYTSQEGDLHTFTNSNHLLGDRPYNGIIGGKTGFTPVTTEGGAGHCLIAAAERNGHILIGTVLNTDAQTPDASALVMAKLFDYGFNNYTWKEVAR